MLVARVWSNYIDKEGNCIRYGLYENKTNVGSSCIGEIDLRRKEPKVTIFRERQVLSHSEIKKLDNILTKLSDPAFTLAMNNAIRIDCKLSDIKG